MVVKICCIQDASEARMAAAAGARFLGLVGAMPSGPGPLPDTRIAEIAAAVPPGAMAVLLTSRVDAAGIVDHVRATGVGGVQIVTHVEPAVRHAVRRALPGVAILQVVHVEGHETVDEARGLADGADYLLLDSGRPSAAVPELGGTGRVHDWSLSARIVGASPVPVFLAGGLRPDNVRAAVASVRPYGLDVCSGLRDQAGRLDPGRLDAFMTAVVG